MPRFDVVDLWTFLPMLFDGQNPGLYSLFNTKETSAPPLSRGNHTFNDPGFGEKLTETQAAHALDWTEKKGIGQYLGKLLRQTDGAGVRYGDEVVRCSSKIWLQQVKDGETWRARPYETCKRRWCPVCEWVKSRHRLINALRNFPVLVPKPEDFRMRFLTLTVRNCTADELPEVVGRMLKGFRKLTDKSKKTSRITADWAGFVRSLEITFNPETGLFHPHLHVLFLTPADSPRHETTEWVQEWRRAAQLDYDPICDIRAVRQPERGMAEVMKYTTKPAKLGQDAVQLAAAIASLKGRRLQQGGGVLLSIFDDPPETDEPPEWEARGTFWWRAQERQYRRVLDV